MLRTDRRAIVFILVFFISILVFSQEKQAAPVMKLREEILAVYQSDGEQGLRDFVIRQKDKIPNKFIVDFAKAGVKERKEKWLKVCEIMAEEKKDEKNLADVLFNIGKFFRHISENKKAFYYHGKALPIYVKLNDSVGQINVHWDMGEIYRVTYDHHRALEQYDKMLTFCEKVGDFRGQGLVYTRKGQIYFHSGDNSKTLEMYDRALIFFKKVRFFLGEGYIYLRKGEIFLRTGKNSSAIEMYNKALPIFEDAGDNMGKGNVYRGKADIFSNIGNYSKAIALYNKALNFFEKSGDQNGQGNVFWKLGRLYYRSGNFFYASEMYDKALPFFKKAGDFNGQGNIYLGKGTIYYYNGDYSSAIEMYDKALTFFEKAGDTIGLGNIYYYTGMIYAKTNDYKKALEFLDKALSFFEKSGSLIDKGNVYNEMGYIHFRKGVYDDALKMYEKALSIYTKIGHIDSIAYTLRSKAQVLVRQGENNKAFDIYEKSVLKMEKTRSQKYFSDMKRNFLEFTLVHYEETALFMLHNKFYEKGFKYVESMKARVFLDQMAEELVPLDKGLKPELKVERDNMVGKLSALTRQMQETGGNDEKKLQQLKEEYRRVESQFDDLLIKIRLENPLYASVNYPQPVTARDLQTEVLKKGETLLSYFISQEKAYAFIVSKGNFKVKELKVNEKEINNYVGRFLHSIKENNTKDMNRFGSLLYEKLFKPLEKYLKKSKEIIIAPAGQLETIPFESLIVAKQKTGLPVYLLEKYRIKYLQSASLLSILRKHYTRKSTSNSFIGFGDPVYDYENFKRGKPEQGSTRIFAAESTEDTESIFSHEDTRSGTEKKVEVKAEVEKGAPSGHLFNASGETLATESTEDTEDEIKEIHRDRYARAGGIMDRLPYSGEEIQTIARLFEKESLKSVVNLREQAVEENAKAANMKDFDYIHFSCHGLLSDDFQSLVLSQLPPEKSKEDGYFTLNEIMNCDYNAKLVVLSACDTGSGKMYKGEGVTGLTRAVMYAGTPAVVASLWKVDDIATKELMVNFYRNMLEKNLDKTEALRQAKLELLKNENYHSPLFWSAFVMYGE